MKSMDMHLQKAWTPGPTCAGVCLLVVDLQEDQGKQQQQPAVGLVWGLLGQGSPAPRGRVKDPTKAPYPGRRRKPGGRRGRAAGAHCFHRHQGHRWRGTGGWWAGHLFFVSVDSLVFFFGLRWWSQICWSIFRVLLIFSFSLVAFFAFTRLVWTWKIFLNLLEILIRGSSSLRSLPRLKIAILHRRHIYIRVCRVGVVNRPAERTHPHFELLLLWVQIIFGCMQTPSHLKKTSPPPSLASCFTAAGNVLLQPHTLTLRVNSSSCPSSLHLQ